MNDRLQGEADVLNVQTMVDEDGYSVLQPDGDLDTESVQVFRQAVIDLTDSGALVIDLADVPFVDAVGVGAIVGGVRRAREHGTRVAVARARPAVKQILRTAGMDRIADLTDTMEEAAEAVHAEK